MSRLNAAYSEDVPAATKSILDNVGAQFGFVPNMFGTLASNPVVLKVVMTLQGALSGVLDAKTRHTIALAVSSELGGMSSDDIDLARSGSSVDPQRAAVARFAQRVVESRGQVSDADLAAVRSAGFTDSQILAIVTVAVQVTLTNFINNVNQTDVDIPRPVGASE
jgi:alkylhydroperoxidase family enzyme